MPHLKASLAESGVLTDNDPFGIEILKRLLYDRFEAIDYESAKDDVRSFIPDKTPLTSGAPNSSSK